MKKSIKFINKKCSACCPREGDEDTCGCYFEGFEAAKRKLLKKLKAQTWDGKEWIEMVKSANACGFGGIENPEDFIDGKKYAYLEIKSIIEKL